MRPPSSSFHYSNAFGLCIMSLPILLYNGESVPQIMGELETLIHFLPTTLKVNIPQYYCVADYIWDVYLRWVRMPLSDDESKLRDVLFKCMNVFTRVVGHRPRCVYDRCEDCSCAAYPDLVSSDEVPENKDKKKDSDVKLDGNPIDELLAINTPVEVKRRRRRGKGKANHWVRRKKGVSAGAQWWGGRPVGSRNRGTSAKKRWIYMEI